MVDVTHSPKPLANKPLANKPLANKPLANRQPVIQDAPLPSRTSQKLLVIIKKMLNIGLEPEQVAQILRKVLKTKKATNRS